MAERTGHSGPFSASAVGDPLGARLAEVEALLRGRQSAALGAAAALERDYPARIEGAVLTGRALQQLGRLTEAQDAASRALTRAPRHPDRKSVG